MGTIFQDIVYAFGWSILNSIWQSGILYAILLIILLLTPKMKSSYRHNLSYGTLIAMFVWFAVTFVNQLTQVNKALKSGVDLNMYELGAFANKIPETFAQKAESLFPIVVTMYLIGIIIQLIVVIKGYLFLQKIKKTALSNIPQSWVDSFEKVKASLNLDKQISFHLSSLVTVPVVAGYLKPIVLFPVALINQLDEEQVEAILIHELSHIRRNDYLLNIVKTCIETLLFFNPFIWLTGKFIQIEREHACDDLVVNISGKPLSYAHTLLQLEVFQHENAPQPAMAATGNTQHLYQRIKRITNMKTNYLNIKQQLAALTLAVAGLLSVAWTNPTVKEKATEITKNIREIEIFPTSPSSKQAFVLVSDTIKNKQKIKISVTDHNGKTTDYISLAELPDSLKITNFYKRSGVTNPGKHFFYKGPITFNTDSFQVVGFKSRKSSSHPDSIESISIVKRGNPLNGEAIAAFKRTGIDLSTQFTNPEEREKWKELYQQNNSNINFRVKGVEIDGKAVQVSYKFADSIKLLLNALPTISVTGDSILYKDVAVTNKLATVSVSGDPVRAQGYATPVTPSPNAIKSVVINRSLNKIDLELLSEKDLQLKQKFNNNVEELKKKNSKSKSKAKPVSSNSTITIKTVNVK